MLVRALATSLLELLKLHQELILLYSNNTTEATERQKGKKKKDKTEARLQRKRRPNVCLQTSLTHFILVRQWNTVFFGSVSPGPLSCLLFFFRKSNEFISLLLIEILKEI